MSLRGLLATALLALVLTGGAATGRGPPSSLMVEPFDSHGSAYTAQTLWGVKWDTGTYGVRYGERPPWRDGLTGAGVRVGIVDTGVDGGHPDLRGSIVAWRDFLNGQPEPYDDDDHGTHVAGIVAASGHWQLNPLDHYFPMGARGVAPRVELVVAKAMNAQGEGTADTVADAIHWAVDPNGDGDLEDGADVINLSIGIELASGRTVPAVPGLPAATRDPCRTPGLVGDVGVQRICSAINRAVDRGVVVVVAAGNHEEGQGDAITFPGTMENVITVGALASDGRVAAFSNRGAAGSGKPDVVAPGVIVSTFPPARDVEDGRRDGYLGLGGTSMAAPVVTGTVALMMEASPALREKRAAGGLSAKALEVRDVLRATASHPGSWDAASGHGAVDTQAAVRAVDDGAPTGVRWGFVVGVLVVGLGVAATVRRRRRRARRRWRVAVAPTAAVRRYAVLAVGRPAAEARDELRAARAAVADLVAAAVAPVRLPGTPVRPASARAPRSGRSAPAARAARPR